MEDLVIKHSNCYPKKSHVNGTHSTTSAGDQEAFPPHATPSTMSVD